MRIFPAISLLFFTAFSVSADVNYSHLLEAPYPPQPTYERIYDTTVTDFDTVDDIFHYELGRPGSTMRAQQEYHRRLLASCDSEEKFLSLHEIGGFLVPLREQKSISKPVEERVKIVFDQSLRRIYYATYGCDTLEESLYAHEQLQSAIAKYYPGGIPLEKERLSKYSKAMANGYRKEYLNKIEKLREKRLTILDSDDEGAEDNLHPGLNPVRLVVHRKTQTPLAVWKAGSDKYYGKFLLSSMGYHDKISGLETTKIEIGHIATWNEILAQTLNFLFRGKFHTPVMARFGNTTLHAYHVNNATLSEMLHLKEEEIETYLQSFDLSHTHHWALMQFLMSTSDSHFSNTLVDGSHLILIDFGRALGTPTTFPLMQLRCSFFEFPQMKTSILDEDGFQFENDLTPWLTEFTEGIEKYEERQSVRPYILTSIDHLRKNLITVRLGMDWGLTPVELCRLKYPPIGLNDHFQMEEAFKALNKKDLFSTNIKATEVRQAMNHTKIFSKAPFLRAYMLAGTDNDLFEYLMEREIEKLIDQDEDDLFTEIQLGWLIRASLLLPVEMKPFF